VDQSICVKEVLPQYTVSPLVLIIGPFSLWRNHINRKDCCVHLILFEGYWKEQQQLYIVSMESKRWISGGLFLQPLLCWFVNITIPALGRTNWIFLHLINRTGNLWELYLPTNWTVSSWLPTDRRVNFMPSPGFLQRFCNLSTRQSDLRLTHSSFHGVKKVLFMPLVFIFRN
jgi:hypothetical protein